MKRAVIFFADGMEECEGLITVDILRRAGIEVIMASVMGRIEVATSHGIIVKTDALIDDVDFDSIDLIILPGGRVGTENLRGNAMVRQKCLEFARYKRVAAICAAPSVLAELGLLEGRQATCHPDFEAKMDGAKLTGGSVAVDGNMITGQGLGATFAFALTLVTELIGKEEAERIAKAICL